MFNTIAILEYAKAKTELDFFNLDAWLIQFNETLG